MIVKNIVSYFFDLHQKVWKLNDGGELWRIKKQYWQRDLFGRLDYYYLIERQEDGVCELVRQCDLLGKVK